MRKFGWLLSLMLILPLICVAQIEEEPTASENPDEYRDCVVYTLEQADAATAPTGNQVIFTFSGLMTRAEVNNVDCGTIAYIDAPSEEGGSGEGNGGGSIIGGGGSSSGNGGGSSGGNSGGGTPSVPSEPEPTPKPEPTPTPTPTPEPEPDSENIANECYQLMWSENKLTGVKTPANPECRNGYQRDWEPGCNCDGWICSCSVLCCHHG